MESMNVTKMQNANLDYEKLYEQIQDVTNGISNFCGFSILTGTVSGKTLQLIDRLNELSGELSDAAHELEEHLAWD